MKNKLITLILLAAITAGCAPKPTPAEPTPDINVIVGTMMAATLTAIAPTPVPPTDTPAPTPTVTPLPPGTLLEEFSAGFTYPNPEYWSDPFDAAQAKHIFSVTVDQDFLKYDFTDPETYLYTFYQKEMPADVRVETSYLMNTTQNSEASVVCRMDPISRNKWYEFRVMHSERAAYIYYYERTDIYHKPYIRISYAPLSVELFKDKENRIEAICKGNNLTMSVNGQQIISIEDARLPGPGLVGIGGISHGKVPMRISYNYLNVVPAP